MIGRWYRKFKVWIWNDSIFFHVYFAFHFHGVTYLKARAIQDYPVQAKATDRAIKSFFRMILRLLTDEVKEYNIQIESPFRTHNYKTDKEGYFFVTLKEEYQENLMIKGTDAISTEASVILINKKARNVIVSDIDDTILMTGVRSQFKWRLLYNSFFKSPWKRKTLDQSSRVYRELVSTLNDKLTPIIYLSNSPWNIFDYITIFLKEHDFPNGIVMLRDIGRQLLQKTTLEESNKYIQLEKLLQIFEGLDFILIGDSGEKDFAIYTSIAKRHPNRVTGIFIRNIGSSVVDEIKQYNEMDENVKVALFKEMEEIKPMIAKW